MWTYVLIAVLIAAAIVAFLIVRQPDTFRIERSAVIDAPPARLHALVDDFHGWNTWSPWARLDPTARNTFEGPSSGPGAVFQWAGNAKVGEGRMTITESRPNELVRIRLEFKRPMAATNEALFTFHPEAGGTRVTWSMTGVNTLMGKAINLVMSVDRMVGKSFEDGLANLAVEAKRT